MQPTEPTPTPPVPPTTRCGILAIIGAANAGKSSLINRILGEKVSIVSPVAQTTRNLVRSFHTEARGQLVFLDTPGVHRAKNELGLAMNRMARAAAKDADAAMYVFDSDRPPQEEDDGWMRRLSAEAFPLIFVANKCDLGANRLADYRKLWDAIRAEKQSSASPVWVRVSAFTGDGLPELLDALFAVVPPGPLLFPEEMLSDYPRKLAIADFIREKFFAVLHDEIPHDLAVHVDELDDTPEGLRVHAIVYLRHPSQKPIVIGARGRILRRVRERSAKEMEEVYEKPVKVELFIKVDKTWQKNFWIMRQLGYQ